MACFGTQTQDVSWSIVALSCGEIDTGDGSQQPCRLPLFLDCATSGNGCCTPLNSATIYACLAHPIHVKWHTRITGDSGCENRLNDLGIYVFCFGSSFGCGHESYPSVHLIG